jgi:hypothetical protein
MLRHRRGTSVYEVYDEETFLAADGGIAVGALQDASVARDRPSSRSGRSWRWPAALALALAALSVAAVVDERRHAPARTSTNASGKGAAAASPPHAQVAAQSASEAPSARPSRPARTTRRVRLADAPRRPAPHATRRRARRHVQVRREMAGATSPAPGPGSPQASGTAAVRQQGRAGVDLEFGFEG